MSARRPSTKFPNRCRAWYGASPTAAGCREFATRIGWPPHRSRGLHHRIWPTPRPSPRALEWRNRIHQRQCLLRVVSVGAGQANREGHAPPVADQMTLAPALGPISGIWAGLVTAADRADGTTVHDRTRPINLVGAREPVQQCKVHQIPNARPLPIAQAPPACHPRPRTRVPAEASAREFRCEGRRRCPSGTRDPKRVVGHLVAAVHESARRVRQDSTTDLEATPRPNAVHATSPTKIRFGRFCYAL